MKIPALDMKAQLAPIRKEIDQAIAGVIDEGSFILGDEVKKLEDEVCRYTGSKYAVGVSNGTDAISLALESLGVSRGDRVICPAFTYYATAGAIAHIGAVPVFVDINPKTYCISPESVKDYLNRQPTTDNRQPKSIIPVHLYGQCADMEAVLSIAKEHNIKVIEDTAQAFGAIRHCENTVIARRPQADVAILSPESSSSNQSNLCHPSASSRPQDDSRCKAGTMGDCGTISFFPGKNLGACGDAGMVLTQDQATAEKLYCLRNQGADPGNKYKHICLGHNNRLDAIQAAVLRVKLKYIDQWNKKRAENASYYNKSLADTGLITPYLPTINTHIYHQYTLRAKNKNARDVIVKALQEKGIDARTFYPIPLHLQPCFSYLGYKKGDFPESEKAADEVFSVPVYPELTIEQMDYVVESIKELL
jgi:dTDP-4-amino-4,6-dideoxygalactose transaminase